MQSDGLTLRRDSCSRIPVSQEEWSQLSIELHLVL